MRHSISVNLFASLLVLGMSAATVGAQTPDYSHVGKTATSKEIKAWDIAIGPAGKELPPGSGTAKQGEAIYVGQCARCHGITGTEGKLAPRLVGGQGTLTTAVPIRTIGSYWPYATTLWDYIHRAMPWKAGVQLSDDQVYAVTAYLLYRNKIIPENEVMDAKSLPKVQMPNRNGFYPNPPVWKAPGPKP